MHSFIVFLGVYRNFSIFLVLFEPLSLYHYRYREDAGRRWKTLEETPKSVVWRPNVSRSLKIVTKILLSWTFSIFIASLLIFRVIDLSWSFCLYRSLSIFINLYRSLSIFIDLYWYFFYLFQSWSIFFDIFQSFSIF